MNVECKRRADFRTEKIMPSTALRRFCSSWWPVSVCSACGCEFGDCAAGGAIMARTVRSRVCDLSGGCVFLPSSVCFCGGCALTMAAPKVEILGRSRLAAGGNMYMLEHLYA